MLPTYNRRGQAAGSVEVGFTVIPPDASPPAPGQNPATGLRIGFTSYHPSLLGQGDFITYNNAGQPISPVTGKVVDKTASHYTLDVLNSFVQ